MIARHKLEAERRRRVAALGREAWRRASAAATPAEALPWLERAHRLVPGDHNIAFALATAQLAEGDAAAALAGFEALAETCRNGEIWTGIAAAARQLGDAARAEDALGRRLRDYATDPATEAFARSLVRRGQYFCGLTGEGHLVTDAPLDSVQAWADGKRLRRLGATDLLRAGRQLSLRVGGETLLGSPIDLRAIRRLEGFVSRRGDRLAGWAWHPAAPDRNPVLRVLSGESELARITATDFSGETLGSALLARPRAIRLRGLPRGPVRVVGEDGQELLGSPLPAWPLTPSRLGRPTKRRAKPGPVAVVVPVYRGLRTTLDCLQSLRAALRPGDRVVVVNDASPDPELAAALRRLAARGEIALHPSCAADPGRNLGFPAAANAGLRAAGSGCDVVLLNSDTLVFAGCIEALQRAAHSAGDIGTATPVGNDASVFSTPDRDGNKVPDPAAARELARLSAEANAGVVVEAPTAHGFCMFIRADCLAATGLLREDVFAQGYGEENDFTERARATGYRHVAVPGVYVAHVGGVSFGAARHELLRRNLGLLDTLHPGYHARIAAFVAADPLRVSRERLDGARWRQGVRPEGAVLLITHDAGGGTALVVAAREAAIRAEGQRAIRLEAEAGDIRLREAGADYPNLRFRLPRDFVALAELLGPDRPVRAEIHHLLGHPRAVLELPGRLGIPYDLFVHDYAWICARIALVTGDGHYCGEPDSRVCADCVRRWGRQIEDRIAPERLRARSAADLAGARRVVVPSGDVAARIRRHFPGVAPHIEPWERTAPARGGGVWGTPRRIAVVGAIGPEKGFDVLLACARDAAERRLPLDFVVVGYTIDDAALLATGHAWITGPFAAEEAASLIRRQRAAFAFLPSIWPETWCFALSDAWAAGLDAAVFDIGTPAERVRHSGRGWVLPLGLPPARVNEALLKLQPLADTPVFSAGLMRERVAQP